MTQDSVARAQQNNAAGATYRQKNQEFLNRITKPEGNAKAALKKAQEAGRDAALLQGLQNVINAYGAAHAAYNNYRNAANEPNLYKPDDIDGYRNEHERLAQTAETTPNPNKSTQGRSVVQPAAAHAWTSGSSGFGQFSVAGSSSASGGEQESYVGKGKGKRK
jgi:hypothetical protein